MRNKAHLPDIQINKTAYILLRGPMTDSKKKYKIVKYSNGVSKEIDDDVVTEYSLHVVLNGKPFVTLLCTPHSLKELVIGFLFSEGIIGSYDDIKSVDLDEIKGKVYIEVSNEDVFSYAGEYLLAHKTITTGCGKNRTIAFNVMSLANKIENGIALDPDKILKLINEFSKSSELFISTGGVHSCALCSYDEILYFEEDIGRHNAMDKLSGSVLINKIYAGDKIILTTGRISSEIITKAAKIGIPVLVSRSAPTDAAIEMALQLNITLIGFARGQSLNIYT